MTGPLVLFYQNKLQGSLALVNICQSARRSWYVRTLDSVLLAQPVEDIAGDLGDGRVSF